MQAVYDDYSSKMLYEFDETRGILQVVPNMLECLLKDIGELPQEGKDLTLPTMYYGERTTFKNVKKVESIPGLKENE